MIKCKISRLPRISRWHPTVPKKDEEIPEEDENVSDLVEVEEPTPEPESEFEKAVSEISVKIRELVADFTKELVANWNRGEFEGESFVFEEENEFDISFNYSLTTEHRFSQTKDVVEDTPTARIMIDSYFGQRTFVFQITRALSSDEMENTLFRSDLVATIASEIAECYVSGTLGGINPDFESDYTYEG